MNLRPALLALGLFATTLLAASPSQAFERQWHAGANLGYTALMGSHATLHGFGGGLHLTYGLTDAFNLMAEVNVSNHFARLGDLPVDDSGKPTGAAAPQLPRTLLVSGAVGVGYVLDVLQWVPYVGALVGAADIATPAGSSARLSLQVPFGLDYSISRSFAVGVGGRYQMLIGGTSLEHTLTALLRAEYVWGY
ncbi:MAG: P44/Msp2 family outer membrane protein [Byssovorax sp.]